MKVFLLFLCAVVLVTAYNVEDSAVETESDEVSEKRSNNCPEIKFKCSTTRKNIIPNVCKNMIEAIKAGAPTLLHRETGVGERVQNRCDSGCSKLAANTKKGVQNLSCDEYPFASSKEGGHGARIMMVPGKENKIQGGILSNFYSQYDIKNGGCYKVKV